MSCARSYAPIATEGAVRLNWMPVQPEARSATARGSTAVQLPAPPWTLLGRLSASSLRDAARAIGDTPLRSVRLWIDGRPRTLRLKLEACNPGGSIKDRTALAMIEDLRRRDLLGPGSVLVESTSGNLGVALAYLAKAHGCRFHAVVDPHVSEPNLALLRELDAEVDVVERADAHGNYLKARLERVQELCAASPAYLWTDQYRNEANPRAHAEGTAPEIAAALPRVDAVVAAVSTGGTVAGLARFFHERSPGTVVVAVDVEGSVAIGGCAARRFLTGIGSSRRSDFLGPGDCDAKIHVSDARALSFCHLLWQETGMKVGGSSGAAIAGAVQLLAERDDLRDVVCICPDDGRKYEESIFDRGWLAERGLDVSRRPTRVERIDVEEPVDWASFVAEHVELTSSNDS